MELVTVTEFDDAARTVCRRIVADIQSMTTPYDRKTTAEIYRHDLAMVLAERATGVNSCDVRLLRTARRDEVWPELRERVARYTAARTELAREIPGDADGLIAYCGGVLKTIGDGDVARS